MPDPNADNKWNIAQRLEATIRYGVISGGDDWERSIAEQQVSHAIGFIKELHNDIQRLSYECQRLEDEIAKLKGENNGSSRTMD